MGITILELDSVDSTNTYAKNRFGELADGTLVASTFQSAGRGRLGRKWESPANVNWYVSLVAKQVSSPVLCGAALGLAALETIRELAPELRPFLKWPNDVYLGDAKIAGILCESTTIEGGRVSGLVAGLGLNVNMSREQLAGLGRSATSLRLAAGREFELAKVLAVLAKSLGRCYIAQSERPAELFERWKAANKLLGQELEVVDFKGNAITGIFTSIAGDGAMLLRTADGVCRRFDCGDVRINPDRVRWDEVTADI